MRAELRRSIFLACVGLLGGFALVVALYGASTLFKHGFGSSAIRSLSDPTAVPQRDGEAESPPGEGAQAEPGKPPGKASASNPVGGEQTVGASVANAGDPQIPTFDIIRVEPTGETVIAGRAAPNTTVELLRDDQPIARALVDPSGQFAIVPPALPTGSSEITLRATGTDGQDRTSRESVLVVVAPGRDTKPLIALTAPDKPTVVLSQPDPAGTPGAPVVATLPTKPGSRPDQAGVKPAPAQADAESASGTAAVKIVSVEAEDGGKLYVTSRASPGATVRLYLNDTLVAPGSVGADGRVAFTIGRGVQPGTYKVRIDQVDPVSGKVKTRSEVAFTVPAKPGLAKPGLAKPELAKPVAGKPATDKSVAASKPLPSSKIVTALAEPSRDAPLAAPPARPIASDAGAGGTAPGPASNSGLAPSQPTRDATLQAAPSRAPGPAPATGESPRTVFVPELNTARITRGDSLWQISRRIYGKGMRYTVIFDANQPQIRNPDRIYPGQIFVLPSDGTAAVPQAEKRG